MSIKIAKGTKMANKLRKSLRMSHDVSVMLQELSKRFGLTETAIIEMSLRKLYLDPTIIPAHDDKQPTTQEPAHA